MNVLLANCEDIVRGEFAHLSTAGVALVVPEKGEDAAEGCTRPGKKSGSPPLVVTRVPLPEKVSRWHPDLGVLFPGETAISMRSRLAVGAPWPVPCVMVGPLVGRPSAGHRASAASIRRAGVKASCRRDMHSWLRVTSAWLAPLRGALLAARERGVRIGDAADLVTLATRAARERLRVMRVGGLPVDVRYMVLLAMPETWAVTAIRKVANSLPDGGSPSWLPSAVEAVEVSQRVVAMAAVLGVKTPAADFLDQFSAEEAARVRQPGPARDVDTSPLGACEVSSAAPPFVSCG